ncbi:ATP-binding protein [Pilimelia columellifera]|uniref:Sensor-like histidine kinase SenX3 n=1 Tax=Pilimelia columellifera subsp. columellifera TaxID=706583 RepID=A0ABN3N9U7_9ACTN
MATLVAMLCTLLALGAGAMLAQGQRQAAIQQLDRRAVVAAGAVAAEGGRYIDSLRLVAAAVGGDPAPTRSRFGAIVAPLAAMRLAGATSIAYLVPATTAQIPATQALWRSRQSADLVLNPAPGLDEHIFSVLSVPLDGGVPRTGIDAARAPAPAQALREARRTGQPAISAPYQLIIDENLPPDQRQLSFSLTVPVFGPAADDGRRPFRGWVIMGLRGKDFIAGTLTTASQGLVDVTLSAADAAPVASLRAAATGRRDLVRRVSVTIADKQWQLTAAAAGRRLPGGSTGLPTVVMIGGVVVGLLLGGLVWLLATGRDRAQTQVDAATADLAEAEADARAQAELFSAILESVSDGVGVVDGDGEFVVHNPAARKILGLDVDLGDPDSWSDYYGLFLPDGKTPFPTERLPLVRALRGEPSDHVEMVIRNEAQPAGVPVTVSGRPLGGGRPGAVAVFHDISEQKAVQARLDRTIAELTEREADLQAFAGVVAHDLKAPLTTMAGYAELLEDLTNAWEPETLATAIARITGGVQRMRQLIDDLLAYATARDGQIAPRPVDLQALAAEVLADRVAATGDPRGAPAIFVGDLPPVAADPAMARQLLENLLGNALKFTQPGQPARIDITGSRSADGVVTIEVADRGIGIPTEQQPKVFTAFHRADRRTYEGTGLGLAICKRIVERHGGTIVAGDNPGGGARITFTLPGARQRASEQRQVSAAPAAAGR